MSVVCSSEACSLAMSVSRRVKIQYLYRNRAQNNGRTSVTFSVHIARMTDHSCTLADIMSRPSLAPLAGAACLQPTGMNMLVIC